MNDFSITTHISAKEYFKIMVTGLYKRPAFIITTVYGLYLVSTVISGSLSITNYDILWGVLIVFAPTLIALISAKQFTLNPACMGDLNFTFTEKGIIIEGTTFKAEFLWAHIIKQKVIGKFLILYHTKRSGNFIDKTKLTSDQLQFIKTKVERK